MTRIFSDGESYTFMVAARSETGSSVFSAQSAPLTMTFSLSESAKHETRQIRTRFTAFRRGSMSKQVPTGAAAQGLRDEFREATQQPDDRYEALRSFRRDEGTTWVSPTGRE
ncbi:MAG: hypothetical protein HIU84_04315 [Acidobacteria bacterium]|nr:hypothetical protein [Acidobacteriota bacterium]